MLVGNRDLRLRGDDWFVTPKEFGAYMEHHRRQHIEQDLRGSAMVCALLANINRDEKRRKEPFTIEDFLPVSSEEEFQNRIEAERLVKLTRAQLQFSGAHNAMNQRKRKKAG